LFRLCGVYNTFEVLWCQVVFQCAGRVDGPKELPKKGFSMGSEGHSTLKTQHSRHVSTRVPHDDRRSSGVVFMKVGDAEQLVRPDAALRSPCMACATARSLVNLPVHDNPRVLCQIVPCDLFHGDVRLRLSSSIDARCGIRLQAVHHVPRVGAGSRTPASLEIIVCAVKSDGSEPPKFVCGLLGVSHWSLWSVSGLTAAARRPATPIPRAEYVLGVVTIVE
jgi:hypothetical protein